MSPKKILFFLPGGVGGAEKMTLTIAQFLSAGNFEVKLVIVGTKTNIFEIIPDGFSKIILGLRNIWCFPIIRILRILRKEKPDFVFCSTMYLNIRVLIASKIYGVRAIIRNDNYLSLVSRRLLFFLKITYPFAYKIIAQQEEMANDIINGLSINPKKVYVRYNPIDKIKINAMSDCTSPYPNEIHINYLWVGNFLRSKGHDILVRAFKIVHNRNPLAHLYFCGVVPKDTSFYEEVRDFVDKNLLNNNVHFLGFQANPYPWVRYADCFVLPSRIEGLPNSLIEAMYLGIPVVATKCIPIIERMINVGVNGYIVESENHVQMAESMLNALELKKCQMTYKPSDPTDFIELFQD